MTKQEFCAIIQPYGCKVFHTNHHKIILEDFGIDTKRWLKEVIKPDYKLVLRNLSDLTKEIEHNGEKFVPASKMITHGFHNTFWYEYSEFDYRYLYSMDLEKLIEWKFDVAKLIEKGEAIDVNTLEINPYK